MAAATKPFRIKVGDRYPWLTINATENGVAFPTPGAVTITFEMENMATGAVSSIDVSTPDTAGTYVVVWPDASTDIAGNYMGRFKITYNAGDPEEAYQSIPTRGYIPVQIVGEWD